jgi:hypothetical protein
MKFDHGISHIVADGPSLCAIGKKNSQSVPYDFLKAETVEIPSVAPTYDEISNFITLINQ